MFTPNTAPWRISKLLDSSPRREYPLCQVPNLRMFILPFQYRICQPRSTSQLRCLPSNHIKRHKTRIKSTIRYTGSTDCVAFQSMFISPIERFSLPSRQSHVHAIMWAIFGISQISNGILSNLEVDKQGFLANQQGSSTYDGYIFHSNTDVNYHGALSRSLGQNNLMNLLNAHTADQSRSNANGEDRLCFSDQEPAKAHSNPLTADQGDSSAHQSYCSSFSAKNLAKRSQKRRGHSETNSSSSRQHSKHNDSRKPPKAKLQGQVNSQDCDIIELQQVTFAVNTIKTGLKSLTEFTATPNAPSDLAASKLERLLARGKSSGLSSWFYFYTAGALMKISTAMMNKGTLRSADIKVEMDRSRSTLRRWTFAVNMTSMIINKFYNKDGWGARAFLIYHALAGE